MKQRILLTLMCYLAMAAFSEIQKDTPLTSEATSNLVLAIMQQPHTERENARKVASIKRASFIQNPDSKIIEALIDNYSFTPWDPFWGSPMRAPKFAFLPARDALITIGDPVIPLLLDKLKITNDEKLRFNYTSLLKEIIGKQATVLLEKTITDLADQKARLEKSLEIARSIKP